MNTPGTARSAITTASCRAPSRATRRSTRSRPARPRRSICRPGWTCSRCSRGSTPATSARSSNCSSRARPRPSPPTRTGGCSAATRSSPSTSRRPARRSGTATGRRTCATAPRTTRTRTAPSGSSRSTPSTRTATRTARSTPTSSAGSRARLQTNSSRYLDTDGNWVSGSGVDRLIVIFSHHTVASMTNLLGTDRVSGDDVAALLLRYPNVVAWVNGHTHENNVAPAPARRDRRRAGRVLGGQHRCAHRLAAAVPHRRDHRQRRRRHAVDLRDDRRPRRPPKMPTGDRRRGHCSSRPSRASSGSTTGSVPPRRRTRTVSAANSQDRNVELLLPKPF